MQTVNPVFGAGVYTTADVGSGADENSGPKAPEGQVGTTAVREISVPRNIQPPSMGASSAVMIVQRSASAVAAQMVGADFQLPAGHTFRPYFWISPRASEKIVADVFQFEDRQAQVIAELSMSEKRARQRFHERFEYRLVDYGYTCTATGADDKQVRNYGVFARMPARKGEVLGVSSGVAYLLHRPGWTDISGGGDLADRLHLSFRREMPDFMSCHRNLLAGVRDNPLNQRTTSKFALKGNSADPTYMIHIAPDNGCFTPMHFVNAANTHAAGNATISFVSVTIGAGQFVVPAFVATRNVQAGAEILSNFGGPVSIDTKNIQAGAEILSNYQIPPVGDAKLRTMSAAAEKQLFEGNVQRRISMVRQLNQRVADKPPISPVVAAPMIYVSEIASKYWRKHGEKTSRR